MPSTQPEAADAARKKVTLWSVETGESIERWPVDARGMVDCGEYVTDPAELPAEDTPEPDIAPDEGGEEAASTDATIPDPVIALSGGYRVERTSEQPEWWKAFGPDGEQIGKSKHTQQEALNLIPATHRPGGAVGVPAEHSPGVPLHADDGG